MRFTLLFVLGFAVVSLAAALPQVFPHPRFVTYSDTTYALAPNFAFSAVGATSSILDNAFVRYRAIVAGKANNIRTDVPFHGIPTRDATPSAGTGAAFSEVIVQVNSKDDSLHLDTNEAYSLEITDSGVMLSADTVFGALRGLESFSQLVRVPYCPTTLSHCPYSTYTALTITPLALNYTG